MLGGPAKGPPNNGRVRVGWSGSGRSGFWGEPGSGRSGSEGVRVLGGLGLTLRVWRVQCLGRSQFEGPDRVWRSGAGRSTGWQNIKMDSVLVWDLRVGLARVSLAKLGSATIGFGQLILAKVGSGQTLFGQTLVLATKVGSGQTWFGQTWFKPNLVWPILVLAMRGFDKKLILTNLVWPTLILAKLGLARIGFG